MKKLYISSSSEDAGRPYQGSVCVAERENGTGRRVGAAFVGQRYEMALTPDAARTLAADVTEGARLAEVKADFADLKPVTAS